MDRAYTLQPRNPGEKLKIAEAVLERRDRNLASLHKRAQKVKHLKSARTKLAQPTRLLSATKLVKSNISIKSEKKRLLLTKMNNKRLNSSIPDAAIAPVLLAVRNDRVIPSKGCNVILKALTQLRLTMPHNGRFLSNTEAVRELLRIAEVYLFFGMPSAATVSTLLHKNAFVRPSAIAATEASPSEAVSPAVPLSDNNLLESLLGSSYGIFCVEDVETVMMAGQSDSFDALNVLLPPFHFQDFRKVASGAGIKTSRVLWGWVKNLDKIIRKVA